MASSSKPVRHWPFTTSRPRGRCMPRRWKGSVAAAWVMGGECVFHHFHLIIVEGAAVECASAELDSRHPPHHDSCRCVLCRKFSRCSRALCLIRRAVVAVPHMILVISGQSCHTCDVFVFGAGYMLCTRRHRPRRRHNWSSASSHNHSHCRHLNQMSWPVWLHSPN